MEYLLELGFAWVAVRLVSVLAGTAYFYCYQYQAPARRSVVGFVRFCLPAELLSHACVRIDLLNMVLRQLAGFWLLVTAAGLIAVLTPPIHTALEAWFGPRGGSPAPGIGLLLLCALIVVLVRDLTDFLVHLAAHRWTWLWEFHAMHHSTQFLTPMSSKRSHPVEDMVQALVTGVVMSLAVGFLAYAAALAADDLISFGFFCYTLCHLANLHTLQHSHVGLSFGRLEKWVISPAQHHLHHDRDRVSCNLGSRLAIWDRIFGTYMPSQPPGSFVLGLPGAMQPHYDSLLKMYTVPFVNCLRLVRARKLRVNRGGPLQFSLNWSPIVLESEGVTLREPG